MDRARHHEKQHGYSHSLNLVDICSERPPRRHRKSVSDIARERLEKDFLNQDTDALADEFVNAMRDLDRRGTKALEERYGKSNLTEWLDDTRKERYQAFKLIAREALKIGEDVIEARTRE